MVKRLQQLLIVLGALAPLSVAPGCGGKGDGDAGTTAAKSPEERRAGIAANQIFTERCVTCHGAKGHGDGPGSAALDPKPRNFGDKTWQSGVTDEHIEQIIKYGGTAVGKSAAMPANPDLHTKDKAAVVTALRNLVRNLGK